MKPINLLILSIAFIIVSLVCYAQEKPSIDLSLIKRENIEFEALKPFFYLIRQEYVIISGSEDIVKLGGNDFFGKGIGIGFLTTEKTIKFPNSVRNPWERDVNFNDYKKTHKPQCTLIKIKNIQDTTYKAFDFHNFEDDKDILSIPFGRNGIPVTDQLITSGSLIIFYSSENLPEQFEDMSYSIIYLGDILWENDEVSNIQVPYLGKKYILGGGLFERIIGKGIIEWKLAGVYVPKGDGWIIKLLQ